MKISEVVQGFIFAYRTQGHAEDTINSYSWRLNVFANYFNKKLFEDLTTDDIYSFFDFLKNYYHPINFTGRSVPFSSASHVFYWRTLKAFFNWCENELKAPNLITTIPKPRYVAPDIKPFNEEEIKLLLHVCSKGRFEYKSHGKKILLPSPTHLRDQAIIMILLDTGMRVGEMTRLKYKDVNLQNGELIIRPFSTGMKTKPRHVFIGANSKTALWKYIVSKKRHFGEAKADDTVFIARAGKDMDRNSVGHALKRIAKRASIQDVHPHRFRHTAAVQYLLNGGDIFTLQRMLGHSSLKMVNYYLTLSNIDLKSVHMLVSPVDRWKL